MTEEDIHARLKQPWLADPAQAKRFRERFQLPGAALAAMPGDRILQLEDRIDLLARFLWLVAKNEGFALGNPLWGEAEWRQAHALLSPAQAAPGQILIPTGGTGGRVKFAIHTWETLSAAVEGYARFWGRGRINAICPLPVRHIGGLMLALRTFLTGGRLWLADPKLAQAPPPGLDLSTAHVSLVGAQLRRALDCEVGWLRECEAVLVGGGPADSQLIDDALAAGIPLYTAYGLTEAAATVALARADEDPTLGTILPHWKVKIGAHGEICLGGDALFRGYVGDDSRPKGWWPTGDRGELVNGKLRVLGRIAGVTIITGGKKVDGAWLAERLSAWPEIEEALVFGEPDPKWGEALQAVAVARADAKTLSRLAKERLMPEMRPKAWRVVSAMPRLENGKPDWPVIRALPASCP